MTLYDILKAARRKETANTDFLTVLRARSSAMYKGVTTITKTLTGSLPLIFNSTGANLANWSLSGNMTQTGTPTPDAPIYPAECGNLVSDNYVLPIVCGGTTTPIYLGEVETTRQVKKLVFDGTENWRLYSLSSATNVERFYLVVSKNCISPGSIISSHFPTLTDNSDTEHIRYGGSPINEIYIYISRSVATTVADLKAWLAAQYAAGTPVCVWYVLATPTTGIVNEPLRKIGDYADTISAEQAGVSIPTVSGSNTFDVSTTLKPSEATIKYYSADALRQLNITQGSQTKKKSTRKKGT